MSNTSKLRGMSLLSAVFGELSQQLPEAIIGTEELLGAAQKLIELSKREYATDLHPDERRHPGYYSYNLCTAFDKFQGRILETEMGFDNDTLADRGPRNGLKELLAGSREDMCLEEVYG
ncbi:hypothetical protein GV827_14250 [Sulfitobacter sp. JBTF-M27]|uniref:Uncharacterized protein n=1 Tax=Sulfitobacter sediminilitoris TaxID=2698830 RepID=A0A6P0CBE4_9RHOB|nr:hypothetical protein [Sulfitobacter sediminilitoris]NEK23561.1 hypothetical protein [Sulfitobacter sediminilitoris]